MSNLKPIDVFIIAGQSNAVGCTFCSTLPEDFVAETFPEALLYQEGNFSKECYARLQRGITLGYGHCSMQMGIEYGISKALSGRGEFALLRYAVGGSNLHWEWLPPHKWGGQQPQFYGHGGIHYANWSRTIFNGISELVKEGYAPQIRALVWMQGESDADKNESIAQAYHDNLKELISAFRATLCIPELPVVIGEIATNAPVCPWSDIVREGQRRFCEEDNNAYFVSTGNIPIGKDGLHFDGAEDYELGLCFGEVLRNIIAKSN